MSSPVIPPRQRLDPSERREQLLLCAISAYARSGVERAGHGDVAKLASVSTATVFNYFPTREALTEAVFSHIRKRVFDMFDLLPPITTTVADAVKAMAKAYEMMADQDPEIIKVFLNWSVAFGPDVRPQYLAFQDEMLTEVTKRLPGEHQDRSDARIILASGNMFALMKLDQSPPDAIQRFVDRVAYALD